MCIDAVTWFCMDFLSPYGLQHCQFYSVFFVLSCGRNSNIHLNSKGETILTEINDLQSQKTYLRTCAPRDDSGHPLHLRSQISIFTLRILHKQRFKAFFMQTTKTELYADSSLRWALLSDSSLRRALLSDSSLRWALLSVFIGRSCQIRVFVGRSCQIRVFVGRSCQIRVFVGRSFQKIYLLTLWLKCLPYWHFINIESLLIVLEQTLVFTFSKYQL